MIRIVTNKSDNHVLQFIGIGGPMSDTETTKVHYIEPDAIPPEVITDITSYEYDGIRFTKLDPLEIKMQHINDYRIQKIASMSSMCNYMITNGIDFNNEHYSLTSTDQINIFRLGSEARSENPPILIYHADGKDCRVYTPEEMISLVTKANTWISYNTTYYNLLKQYINACTTIDSILAINYFSPLPSPYSEELSEMVDISPYDDFLIIPIQDPTDYSSIIPTIDATECINDYKEEEKRKHQEMLDKLNQQ